MKQAQKFLFFYSFHFSFFFVVNLVILLTFSYTFPWSKKTIIRESEVKKLHNWWFFDHFPYLFFATIFCSQGLHTKKIVIEAIFTYTTWSQADKIVFFISIIFVLVHRERVFLKNNFDVSKIKHKSEQVTMRHKSEKKENQPSFSRSSLPGNHLTFEFNRIINFECSPS